ncbi:MAG: hypothetical protein GX328_06990 [Clostridiaceae bacterium]|nr:hypothetical protein [Clostridiaceae bacterium]
MEYKTLKNITLKIASGATPRGGQKVYIENGMPLIRSQNVLDFSFSKEGLVFINQINSEQLSNVKVEKNDVLLNITGDSVARACIFPEELKEARVNQHVMIVRPYSKVMDTNYLLCYLQYIKPHLLQLASGGATRKALTKSMVENLSVPNITIEEQRKQTNLLMLINEKIKNNNKIISNLENQAQAIFKSWFVDFEPFQDGEFVESELGLIPEGWTVVELLELVDFVGGSQPPKSEHIYDMEPGYVRFIQNRDYNSSVDHLTYIKENSKNKMCTREDILMDKYGEAGKIRFGLAGAYNVALAKIDPLDIKNREYIRRFLEQEHVQRYIYNSSMASTRPSVSKNTLTNIKLVYPNTNLLETFTVLSEWVVNITLRKTDENKTLAQLRDTLLPKLMSGEIDVSNISVWI